MTNDPPDQRPDDLHPDPETWGMPELETDVTRSIGVGGSVDSVLLPEKIGRYRIIRAIGQGGMGAVYEAEQESPKRRVALKVIKAGAISGSLLRRFEIEAQILGKLDHPGIATIFEAGTFDSGAGAQPFFAMEYVEGELLTKYAFGNKLSTRKRLELLAKIAEAVQHAHQKGVIHRDLKPGNILVTKDGQIKILDFGVARATDADIQTATMQTDIGQLIGTIPYMSPEQASGNPDDLDTRSDVYALGIVAYELLTGQLPYDVERKMIHEAVRVIREDAPRPLSSINRTFRGDVEIIIGKALVKEKDRRYQSASDFASDIHRYLNNEPIIARPPSTWYQLSKFSKRNKVLVIGVTAVLIVSVVGALVSINYALGEAEQKRIAQANAEEARTAEESTQRELTRANEVKRLITDMFVSINPEEALGQDISLLKGILDDTARRLSAGDVKDELVVAELHAVIGDVYRKLGLYDDAENHLPKAGEILNRVLGEEHTSTMDAMNTLAALYSAQGRLDETESLLLHAQEVAERLFGKEHPDTLLAMSNLATVYMDQGRSEDAEPLYVKTLELRKRVLGQEHPHTLESMNNLAVYYNLQDRFAEAEPLFQETLEIRSRVLGLEHPRTLTSMNNLAVLYDSQGRYVEAEQLIIKTLEICNRILGEEHPDTLDTMNNLADLYHILGRLSEAEQLHLKTLKSRESVLGTGHPDTLDSMNNLAVLYDNQGRYAEAEPLYLKALEIGERVLVEGHQGTLETMSSLASMYRDQGRYSEAEPLYLKAMETRKRIFGEENPHTLQSMHNIASLYGDQGRFVESESILIKTVELRKKVLGREHLDTLDSMTNLAILYHLQARYSQAEPLYLKSLEISERVLGMEHLRCERLLWNLTYTYQDQGNDAQAEPFLRQLLEISLNAAERQDADAQAMNTAAWHLLTYEIHELRDPERALDFAERACVYEESDEGINLWMYLDTFAFAQHMTGDNASAVETEKRAILLLPEGTDEATITEMNASLQKYEAALAESLSPADD